MFCVAPTTLAGKADLFPGPVQARVLDVLDGDTFTAEALVWPGHSVRVNIRIRGIDAPEMKSRCEHERVAARRAREALAEIIGAGGISISNIGGAKYYGRVLADVATGQGEGVALLLLERSLVRGYDGGKRASWCG
ncbi:MAG TPA: thermonuclease family protein [Nitrobacter sp.]|nr:thermonuclease family protein [Nitrobacter sp.]